MGFGHGYQPRESVKLPTGEYEAAITGARFEQTKKGTPYLAVYVQIKGIKGARPNCMMFYDRPYTGKAEMERWDEKWTEFCDAFQLPRNVTEDFSSWHGKRGWVKCLPQKTNPEFSRLYPVAKRDLPQDSSQEGAPDYTPVDGGEADSFPEDIPF